MRRISRPSPWHRERENVGSSRTSAARAVLYHARPRWEKLVMDCKRCPDEDGTHNARAERRISISTSELLENRQWQRRGLEKKPKDRKLPGPRAERNFCELSRIHCWGDMELDGLCTATLHLPGRHGPATRSSVHLENWRGGPHHDATGTVDHSRGQCDGTTTPQIQ